jgi:hypothetical protein
MGWGWAFLADGRGFMCFPFVFHLDYPCLSTSNLALLCRMLQFLSHHEALGKSGSET